MNGDLSHKAISAALSGNWEKAIEINSQILKIDSRNIDALNRLARAYSETGNIPKARGLAQKVLTLDHFNTIANKSIEKWKNLKAGETHSSKPSDPNSFLEEPGKTKIASLLHLGDPRVLSKLDSGDEVLLTNHGHRTSITTLDGNYIGRLSDDLSARLRNLIKEGNKYKACIKSVDKKDVKVFIRETFRAAKLSDVPSFVSEKIDYISFTPPELVHNKDEIVQEVTVEEE